MTKEEKKIITREKHPERVAQGNKLMKKRKKEILRKKEKLQNSPSVQSTERLQNSLSVNSNDAYVYGVGMLAFLAIGVCVFFTYNTFQPKKTTNEEKQDQPPKRRHML